MQSFQQESAGFVPVIGRSGPGLAIFADDHAIVQGLRLRPAPVGRQSVPPAPARGASAPPTGPVRCMSGNLGRVAAPAAIPYRLQWHRPQAAWRDKKSSKHSPEPQRNSKKR